MSGRCANLCLRVASQGVVSVSLRRIEPSEASTGDGEVRFERQPRQGAVIVGPLHPDAACRSTRRRVASIARKHVLRLRIEHEKRHRGVEPIDQLRSGSNLRSFGTHQKWRCVHRDRRIRWGFPHGHTACVVAVEPIACVDKILSLRERPENQRQLGAAHDRSRIAGIVRAIERIHTGCIEVAAPAEGRAEPIRPVHGVLRIDADAVFGNEICSNI